MFAYIHKQHHAHANTSLDPDKYASHGSMWWMPLKWATLMPHYIVYIVTNEKVRNKSQFIMYYVTLASVMALLHIMSAPVIRVWILPQIAATGMLAFALDYLPHAGLPAGRHKNTRNVSTSVLAGCLTFMQSLHAVHHANSRVPWWRYRYEVKKKADAIRA